MGNDVGYIKKIIVSYSISNLKNKDKVRFYYALKGRDGKSGIIKYYKIHQFGKTVLMVDKKDEMGIDQFLNQWKCKSKKVEVLIKDEVK